MKHNLRHKDLTGRRFGKLEVVKRSMKRNKILMNLYLFKCAKQLLKNKNNFTKLKNGIE